MYKVHIEKRAGKALRKLPKDIIKRITLVLTQLQDDPFPAGCRNIAGSDNSYRIRVGAYRIIYSVEEEQVHILVLMVGHRKDVYQNL